MKRKSGAKKKKGPTFETTPDGVLIETHEDGLRFETYQDGRTVQFDPDGLRIETFPDGRTVQSNVDGSKLEKHPDGAARPGDHADRRHGDDLVHHAAAAAGPHETEKPAAGQLPRQHLRRALRGRR